MGSERRCASPHYPESPITGHIIHALAQTLGWIRWLRLGLTLPAAFGGLSPCGFAHDAESRHLLRGLVDRATLITPRTDHLVSTAKSTCGYSHEYLMQLRLLPVWKDKTATASMFNLSLKTLRTLLVTPDLYFYDYFAKRINRNVDDSPPHDAIPTYRHQVSWGPASRKAAEVVGVSRSR
jgi:hypothetical protein